MTGPYTRALGELVRRLEAAAADSGRAAAQSRSGHLSLMHTAAQIAYMNAADMGREAARALAQFLAPAGPDALAEAVAELAEKIDALAAEVKALREKQ